MSVQEAAYLCLVELWPRKCQPGVLYFNTNIPNERIRLLKSEEEMLEMPENIYTKRELRYIQNGNYLCLAESAASRYENNVNAENESSLLVMIMG